MRKLIVLTLCCGGFLLGAAAAQANSSSSKHELRTQLQRYYHARGYIKAIGHAARTTIYNPNHRIKIKWQRRLQYLITVRDNSAHKIAALRAPPMPSATNEQIVCSVFGRYCSQAEAVASCESHFDTNAENGQYLGMFQMGDYARARYGHGSDALTQARAAYHYFADSGYDWSPWECKP